MGRRKKLIADVEALFSRNVCEPDEEKACREEIGSDEFWKGACNICEKKKRGDRRLHPRTLRLFHLRWLVKARFPFRRDDLTYQDWLALGQLEEMIERKTRIF